MPFSYLKSNGIVYTPFTAVLVVVNYNVLEKTKSWSVSVDACPRLKFSRLVRTNFFALGLVAKIWQNHDGDANRTVTKQKA